jgi:hypothetical protein
MKAVPLLELCSRGVTMVRITCMSGGSQNKVIANLVYLPYDSDKTNLHHPGRSGLSMTTAAGGESNSSLLVVPVHTISYEGALAPTQQEKP